MNEYNESFRWFGEPEKIENERRPLYFFLFFQNRNEYNDDIGHHHQKRNKCGVRSVCKIEEKSRKQNIYIQIFLVDNDQILVSVCVVRINRHQTVQPKIKMQNMIIMTVIAKALLLILSIILFCTENFLGKNLPGPSSLIMKKEVFIINIIQSNDDE